MKVLLLLAVCAGCATDAEPTAPYYTSFTCAIADRFLTCDLGVTDPDGDFERLAFQISEQDGTRFEIPQQAFPELDGVTEGIAHFEFSLPETPTGALYIAVRMFDRSGASTLVHHPTIELP